MQRSLHSHRSSGFVVQFAPACSEFLLLFLLFFLVQQVIHLGMIRIAADTIDGFGPDIQAFIPQMHRVTDILAELHGNPQILAHQLQRKRRVKGTGEHELLDLVFGRIIASGGGIDHLRHHRRIKAKTFADVQCFDRGHQVLAPTMF